MRKVAGFTVAAIAVCLMAENAAFAQGRGGPGGGMAGMRRMMNSPLGLLGRNDVRKELKISDEQKTKIEEIQQELFQGFGGGGGGGGGQNLSDEERKKRFDDMRKKGEAATEKATALLTDDQKVRLKQVRIWAQGAYVLTENEDVAKELKITDEQKEAVKLITEEADKKIGEIFAQGGGFQASEEQQKKTREQLGELRKTTDEECQAVLTDAQKAQLDKLKGPKFELDPNERFGGGRGGPGGRRGRPGGNTNN